MVSSGGLFAAFLVLLLSLVTGQISDDDEDDF